MNSDVFLLVCLLVRLDSETIAGLCMGHMLLVILKLPVVVLQRFKSGRVIFIVPLTLVSVFNYLGT